MASNVVLSTNVGTGATAVTKQISHDGDTAQLPGSFVMGISGTEDSYTAAAINGDATNGLDCDVTRVIPGTSATHLGKAEDAAHTSGDTGVMALAVRSDTAAALATTDGDYIPLITDASGRLHVNVGNTITVGSHAVTNAGTFAVQESGAALTALQLIDDPVIADDAAFTPATSKVMMVGAQCDDTGTDSVDEGDAGAVRMSANRNLYVRVRDNAGNERGLNIDANGEVQISGSRNAIAITDNSGSLTVDNGGTFATQAAQSGTWNITNVSGTVSLPTGASTAAKQPALGTAGSASTDVISVQGIASMTPILATLSGTNNIATVTTVTTVSAVTAISNALPAGTNLLGKVVADDVDVIYQGTTALTTKYAKISAASSGENTLVTGVSSKKILVHSIALIGTGTAVSIYFKDAASGTAIFADGTNSIPIDKSGAAGAGGFILPYNPKGWFKTAASGALILNLSTAQGVAGGLQYSEVS